MKEVGLEWRVSEWTREVGFGIACFRVYEGSRRWDGVFQSVRMK